MAFDGIMTYAMSNELKEKIKNGRISKIYQPYKNELLFQIRSQGKNLKLLLSSHPSYARVHITRENYDNPVEPPMFCMLLRKHLEGSIIEMVEQVEMERIIVFHIQSKNEIGDISYKQLIVEIMGRHSNIILVDKDKNIILDSIKHIPPAVNRHRTVLPGNTYMAPPAQGKVDPFSLTKEQFLMKLDFNAGKIDKQIVNQFAGISPLLAKEIVHRAGLVNRNSLSIEFLSIMEQLKEKQFDPQLITADNKEHFYMLDLTHLNGEKKQFSSLSEMLDRFYYGKAERDRVKQQANDLERFIKNEYSKNKKKIKKLEIQLTDANKADRFQLYGELLTANMHLIKRGDENVSVINYYDEEGGTVTIELNPQKTPSQNAQQYFQKYQKLKNSVDVVKEQIELAKQEMDYFDSLQQQIETASPKDIEEIREELADEGYFKKKRNTSKKKNKQQKTILENYIASDGTEIVVGKNNKQNEYLTNRFARKTEIWLHTKDIPGSHVVIRNEQPTEQTLKEAAIIAAYFSKARSSSKVPVDYTQIRHVKKPNGAKPGYVIYENQTTLFVTPDEDLVRKLRK